VPAFPITKCQGTGNDFVLFDNRASRRCDHAAMARALCDRRFGVGADGLLVLVAASSPDADCGMRIFNADGSEAEMCGNGIRCAALYLARADGADGPRAFETAAGIVRTEPGAVKDTVRVEMGVPTHRPPTAFDLAGTTMEFARVAIGNPHAVVFVDEPLETFDLERLAARLAREGADSGGINVEVARVEGAAIAMRVSERGVGETWACGTGAVAAAVAAIASGRAASPVEIVTKGGSTTVNWGGEGTTAFLTGPARLVFDTIVELSDDTVRPGA
jgi:diaminopimelate epimerase